MGFSRLGLAIGGAMVISVVAGCLTWANRRTSPELPWMMLGIIGIFTFLALGWQFSQKRAARRLLERDA
ncbi:Multidrug resistance protein MdtH [Escherichia coli]|uniref:Multidrug resistance protein MdtH n=1 Tax=Escherichia coli TaxID=562 RepID=A0A376UB48_ECOLX|nr:Multidrug resistance protein MdtH [Escherichia coli]